MNIEQFNVFLTPIFCIEYPESENLQKNLVPKLYEYQKQNPIEGNYNVNGYTSFFNCVDVLKEISVDKDFIEFLNNSVNYIHKSLSIPGELEIATSWFSINKKNSYHESHHHLPNVWSCVYYLETNENDANITFHHPGLESHWPYKFVNEFNPVNVAEYTLKPIKGNLIVFPSYLKHKVEQQLEDRDRITLAINFDYIKEQK